LGLWEKAKAVSASSSFMHLLSSPHAPFGPCQKGIHIHAANGRSSFKAHHDISPFRPSADRSFQTVKETKRFLIKKKKKKKKFLIFREINRL
jgi:hypothetical protein